MSLSGPNLPLKPNVCCGYPVDAGESFASALGEVDYEPDPDPHAGDIGLCLNCGTYLVYLDDHNNCRLAELQDLIGLTDKRRLQLKKARRYVRKRGRFWPKKKAGERFSPN
jgi:hypothetical protein